MEEQLQYKPSKSRFIKIVAGSLVAIALIGGGVYYYEYQQELAQQEKIKKIQMEEAMKEKYRTDLLNTADLMLSVAQDAERITHAYSEVWYDAIWNDGVFVNGQYTSDFNEALLLKQEELSDDIDTMKARFDTVNQQMMKLNQPPKEFQQAYQSLLQLQSITSKYVDMAENPHGTLQTFNQDISEYSSDFISVYNTFKTLVPNVNKDGQY